MDIGCSSPKKHPISLVHPISNIHWFYVIYLHPQLDMVLHWFPIFPFHVESTRSHRREGGGFSAATSKDLPDMFGTGSLPEEWWKISKNIVKIGEDSPKIERLGIWWHLAFYFLYLFIHFRAIWWGPRAGREVKTAGSLLSRFCCS